MKNSKSIFGLMVFVFVAVITAALLITLSPGKKQSEGYKFFAEVNTEDDRTEIVFKNRHGDIVVYRVVSEDSGRGMAIEAVCVTDGEQTEQFVSVVGGAYFGIEDNAMLVRFAETGEMLRITPNPEADELFAIVGVPLEDNVSYDCGFKTHVVLFRDSTMCLERAKKLETECLLRQIPSRPNDKTAVAYATRLSRIGVESTLVFEGIDGWEAVTCLGNLRSCDEETEWSVFIVRKEESFKILILNDSGEYEILPGTRLELIDGCLSVGYQLPDDSWTETMLCPSVDGKNIVRIYNTGSN